MNRVPHPRFPVVSVRSSAQCRHIDGRCGDVDTTAGPLTIDGRPHFPALEMTSGGFHYTDGAHFVALVLTSAHGGHYLNLAPDGARALAQALVLEADKIDANVAALAAGVIARARPR